MNPRKIVTEIWNNEKLRYGDFYELAIEVSSNENSNQVKELSKRLFELEFIKGPFNSEFESVELDLEYFDI